MADTILTIQQIENLFQSLTTSMLGYATTDSHNNLINQDKVRVAWPTGGAPGWKIDDDIAFIKVTPSNDPIVQQRDIAYQNKNSDYAIRSMSYTRAWSVQWTLYGPNSYDRADLIRHALFLLDNKELLESNNLALVPVISAPTRAPELFDGRWWERADLTAVFYEAVTRNSDIPYIKEIESVTIVTEND